MTNHVRPALAAALAVSFVFLMPINRASGYAEMRVYKPSSADMATNEYGFGLARTSAAELTVLDASTARCAASEWNGGLVVFTSAFAGGASCWAAQRVNFYAPEPLHVYATTKMIYTGSSFTYGFASWAGSSWRWRVDYGPWHDHDIDAAFTLQTIGGKVIDLAFLALNGVTTPLYVEAIIDVVEAVWTSVQLGDNLAALLVSSQATSIEESVHFTVPAGYHTFDFGLKSTASALLTGFGCAFYRGQVEEVRLGLNTQPGLLPDLHVSGIVVPAQDEIRTHAAIDIIVERSNIGNAQADLETYELVALPPPGGDVETIMPRGTSGGRGYTIIPAYTTVSESMRYTFTEKGTYELLATIDPEPNSLVPELDELNNQSHKIIHVLGSMPYQPQTPNFGYSSLELQRNQTFTFSTTGTDLDGDPLFYRFEVQPDGDTNWHALVTDANAHSNGWGLSSQLAVTPVLSDPDLLPHAGMGIAPGTHVVLTGNQYRVRALTADADGISQPSAGKPVNLTLNTVPAKPSVTGDLFSDTLKGVSLRVTGSDPEGDRIAFRFDWGESPTPQWTDWTWCDPGQYSLTNSHVYSNGAVYCISVQATDLYSVRNTSPVAVSAAATHCVDVSPYWAAEDSLTIVTRDKDRQVRLPHTGFTITGASNITASTDAHGYWETTALPGTYTATFSSVEGYLTPASQSGVLPHKGSIDFRGDYDHKEGAIQVYCNTPGAGTITGLGAANQVSYTFAGSSWSRSDAWIGDYEINYEPADEQNFGLPVPSRGTNTVTTSTAAEFYGRYIKRPLAALSFTYPTNNYVPPNAFVLAREDEVVFDASASYCPEQPRGPGDLFPPLTQSIVRCRFDFDDSRPYEEDVDTDETTADGVFDLKTRHEFTATGTRTVSVQVFDSSNCPSWGPTSVDVWVKERPEAHITIDPDPAIAGEVVTFSGEGTDGDPGDTIEAYEWTRDTAQLLSTNQSFAVSNLGVGVHMIGLRVRGNDDVWSPTATVSLVVFRPKEWRAFKRDERRHSCQESYYGRTFGELPYGLAPGNWPYLADSEIEGSPIAAELDGNWNNGLEIAFVSRTGTLYVVDNAGSLRWSAATGPSSATPAAGDLDGDGTIEVVVGSGNGIHAFGWNGTNHFPTYGAGTGFEFSMPVIADIDPRVAGREVAVTADDGSVHLVYEDGTGGTGMWPFTYPGPLPMQPMFSSAPAVANIDTNHVGSELILGGTDGNLYVLNSDGANIGLFPVPSFPEIHTTPAVADFCPLVEGQEIVFGADDGVMYCVNYCNGVLSAVWTYTVMPYGMIRSSPAVGRLGEDRHHQLTFGCDNGNLYMLQGTNGLSAGSYSCSNVAVRATPAIANIDTLSNRHLGDPAEVIVAATDGTLHAATFAAGGTAAWQPPMSLSAMPIFSSAAVADIDHDPDLEILVGGTDKYLYALKALPNPALVPIADFTAAPTSGDRPLSVAFSDTSANAPTFWYWDFGDGIGSFVQDPTHEYETPGTYTVSLTARNAHGENMTNKTNHITVNAVPLAAFAGDPVFGAAPLSVQFTNLSLFGPDGFVWDFGDTGSSTQPDPLHVYAAPGFYTVSLSVSNQWGTDVAVKTNYIGLYALGPVADFTRDPKYGCAPLEVQFTDQSANAPTSWDWSFGDGSASSQQHPLHTYDSPGRYLVGLTVTNTGGTDSQVSATYVCVMVRPTPTSVLMLDLPMDENAGPVAYDATTNQHDGVLSGAMWTGGHSGSGLYFSGGGQWVNGDCVIVSHEPSLAIEDAFSVEAWFETSSGDNYLTLVDKYQHLGGDDGAGFTLYLTGGVPRFTLYSGPNGSVNCWGSGDLRNGAWHHVTALWDGATARVYVDGEEKGQVAWTHPPASTAVDLAIGKRLGGWGGYMPFEGVIDEVKIARLIPAERPLLHIACTGPELTVSWTNCGILQAAEDIMNTWTDVLDCSGSPYIFTPDTPRSFYRLRVP